MRNKGQFIPEAKKKDIIQVGSNPVTMGDQRRKQFAVKKNTMTYGYSLAHNGKRWIPVDNPYWLGYGLELRIKEVFN